MTAITNNSKASPRASGAPPAKTFTLPAAVRARKRVWQRNKRAAVKLDLTMDEYRKKGLWK